jgi:hypothetical protein
MQPGTSTVFEVLSIGVGDDDREIFGSLGVIVTAR